MWYPSRHATLAAIGLILATVQAIEGVSYLSDAEYLSVLLFMAAFFGGLAGLKMWCDNCFGSRFALAMVAASVIVGHVLSLTAGLPGSTLRTWTGAHGAIGFISLAAALIILVMMLPHSFRSTTGTGSESPV